MKFIKCEYQDNVTIVTMEHLGLTFKGKARCIDEDMLHFSKIRGGQIAEEKATIKALKYEREIEKRKCEEIRKFVKACRCYKNWENDSKTAKVIYRQLNRRIAKVDKITDEINSRLEILQRLYTYQKVVLGSLDRGRRTKIINNSF